MCTYVGVRVRMSTCSLAGFMSTYITVSLLGLNDSVTCITSLTFIHPLLFAPANRLQECEYHYQYTSCGHMLRSAYSKARRQSCVVDVDQEGAISAYFKLVQFKCKLAYSIKIKNHQCLGYPSRHRKTGVVQMMQDSILDQHNIKCPSVLHRA